MRARFAIVATVSLLSIGACTQQWVVLSDASKVREAARVDATEAAKVKVVAKAFWDALLDGNATEARKYWAGEAKASNMVDRLAAFMAAQGDFEKAITAKFGPDACRQALEKNQTLAETAEALSAAIDAGTVTRDGDRATIGRAPDAKESPESNGDFLVPLKNLKGEWRVEFPAPSDLAMVDDQILVLDTQREAVKKVTDDVIANKYATAQAAGKDFVKAFHSLDNFLDSSAAPSELESTATQFAAQSTDPSDG